MNNPFTNLFNILKNFRIKEEDLLNVQETLDLIRQKREKWMATKFIAQCEINICEGYGLLFKEHDIECKEVDEAIQSIKDQFPLIDQRLKEASEMIVKTKDLLEAYEKIKWKKLILLIEKSLLFDILRLY